MYHFNRSAVPTVLILIGDGVTDRHLVLCRTDLGSKAYLVRPIAYFFTTNSLYLNGIFCCIREFLQRERIRCNRNKRTVYIDIPSRSIRSPADDYRVTAVISNRSSLRLQAVRQFFYANIVDEERSVVITARSSRHLDSDILTFAFVRIELHYERLIVRTGRLQMCNLYEGRSIIRITQHTYIEVCIIGGRVCTCVELHTQTAYIFHLRQDCILILRIRT